MGSSRLLSAVHQAAVQLDMPPAHRLRVVDPCVLAWLAEPHLVRV
jgi:hypothetical protein